MEYFRTNILTVCFNNTFSLYEIIVIFLAEKLPTININMHNTHKVL